MNSIYHRISVRKYEDKPVEKEKIMEILKAGMQAPSAGVERHIMSHKDVRLF